MRITPTIFDAFLKCATKCHLRSLGETGSGNEYADWVRGRDESYQREAVRALQETVPETERVVAPPAAEAVGYRSAGIEIDKDYFRLAEASIPRLAALYPTFEGDKLEFDSSDYPQEAVEEGQLTMALAESAGHCRVRKG